MNTETKKTRIQRENERKIVAAATELFGRHGLRGATLDQIAQNADLSKQNLLYYFPSKKALYQVALGDVLDKWMMPLNALDPNGSPREQLGNYIDQKMKLSRDYPHASRMYALEVIDGGNNIVSQLEGRFAEILTKKKRVLSHWIKTGQIRKVDPVHLLFMIWAATQHYADFEAQVRSLSSKTLQDASFYRSARRTVKDIIFGGVLEET